MAPLLVLIGTFITFSIAPVLSICDQTGQWSHSTAMLCGYAKIRLCPS